MSVTRSARTGTLVLAALAAVLVALPGAAGAQTITATAIGSDPRRPRFTTPVVADPEETGQNLPRMTAYTFFKVVEPGTHRVEVLFAGCCSASPPASPLAWAGSPVLAIHYR